MKAAYICLAALWALFFVIAPSAGEETELGGAIARAISAFGLALLLWAPIVGTVSAIRWWRQKSH